jgi:outer membrane lipoprotein SlyB
MSVITNLLGGITMSNITTQVAKSSGFGEQPIRVGSSSFSRPAALIGGATALIALTAIATTLAVRPAVPVAPSAADVRTAAVAAQALMTSPNKVSGQVESDKAAPDDSAEMPAPKAEAKPAPRVQRAPQRSAGATPAAAKPVAAVCNTCGVVETVTPFEKKGEGSGIGAVAGGVIGGVVGNQIGGGNGRKAMTVLGAVGGGVAGHEIEKRQRATTLYAVKVRMDDGSLRSVTQSTAPTVGQKVTLDGTQIKARG